MIINNLHIRMLIQLQIDVTNFIIFILKEL